MVILLIQIPWISSIIVPHYYKFIKWNMINYTHEFIRNKSTKTMEIIWSRQLNLFLQRSGSFFSLRGKWLHLPTFIFMLHLSSYHLIVSSQCIFQKLLIMFLKGISWKFVLLMTLKVMEYESWRRTSLLELKIYRPFPVYLLQRSQELYHLLKIHPFRIIFDWLLCFFHC